MKSWICRLQKMSVNCSKLRDLRPRVLSHQELEKATPRQQMQQAVLNSLQTDFEEADGRHFAEAGIAASLAERPMKHGAEKVDAFEAMRATGRAKAGTREVGHGAPDAGMSVDWEGRGGLEGGDMRGGMAEDSGETQDDSASSEDEQPDGDTGTSGRVRARGTVGQVLEGTEWAGDDVRTVGKGKGMCVTTLNLRRFGSGPTSFEDQHILFRGIKAMGADFAGFADVGTSAGRQGNGDVEVNTTAGNAIDRAGRWWGGRHMTWCHGQGLRGLRGSCGDLPEGGVGLGVSSAWRARVGLKLHDTRGWGRYAGVVLEGAHLWNRAVAIIQVYAPSRGGATWKRQQALMDEMRGRETGIESDPGAQFLRDLHDLLLPMMLAKKRGVAFAVMGDFNMG